MTLFCINFKHYNDTQWILHYPGLSILDQWTKKKAIQWNSMNISGLSFSYWKKNPGGPNIFKYKETSNLAKMIWKLGILQREFHTFLNRWFSLTISGWIPITCRLKTEKTSTAFKLTWSVYTLYTLYTSLENVLILCQ